MSDKILSKLDNYINTLQEETRVDEKDYKITASDSAMSGKIVVDLSQLPRNLQKTAIKNLQNGDYSVDDIAGWLVINT